MPHLTKKEVEELFPEDAELDHVMPQFGKFKVLGEYEKYGYDPTGWKIKTNKGLIPGSFLKPNQKELTEEEKKAKKEAKNAEKRAKDAAERAESEERAAKFREKEAARKEKEAKEAAIRAEEQAKAAKHTEELLTRWRKEEEERQAKRKAAFQWEKQHPGEEDPFLKAERDLQKSHIEQIYPPKVQPPPGAYNNWRASYGGGRKKSKSTRRKRYVRKSRKARRTRSARMH
jgi:hypothetical protein